MKGIVGAFSNLEINSDRTKFPKNGSTVSLPNMVLSERPTIPSKFIRSVCDEREQPVDFSKKYCDTTTKNENKDLNGRGRSCSFNNVVKSLNNSFTMYAETDLDQPTDYSLRYAEDDSDSERCNKVPKAEATEFVQDTVKTYCTEDTPYETPFNFSTSTSMSDLRIDDKAPMDSKLGIGKSPNITVINNKATNRVPRKIKTEFSSGIMSPEKPVNYCEEGTPGYFSRVPSCGSLNSIPANEPPKQELKPQNIQPDTKKEIRRAEAKAVKFEEVVNYAEETPLMFSRSSSLASLDSIDQHSIHDDRSSVVSDLSRLTSGVISPSELPDSPSQTVPPSPRPVKTTIVFPQLTKKQTEEVSKTAQSVPKCSVFEDVVKKFKVESTPIHFSSATSLSSLMDDEADGKENHDEKSDTEGGKGEVVEKLNDLDLNNDLSESSEDEDILAACINIGMQSNRYSQSKSKSSPPFSPNPEASSINTSRISLNNQLLPSTTLPKSDVTSDSLRTYCTEGTPALLSHAGSNSDLSVLSINVNEKPDALDAEKRALCDLNGIADVREKPDEEEPLDAKATIEDSSSRRSSFSCLSDGSDDSALLEECILSGMPKSKAPISTQIAVSSSSGKHKNGNQDNESSDDEEIDILENCIKIGIENNRYTQTKVTSRLNDFKKPQLNEDDTVKRYYTEDTPAILSHAGSSSNLSVLSIHGSENGATNYFSDLNSNYPDDDDDRLLEECVKHGMAAICSKVKPDSKTESKSENRNLDKGPNDESASLSAFSDDSYDTDQLLLEQCIKAGMPKRPKPTHNDSNELSANEKTLLQQCILEGMKKCRTVPGKRHEDDSSELTQAEQALLRQCILAGMPKNKNLSQGGPSRSRESTELTESERLLLQQCIISGMPKSRSKNVGGSRQWVKKSKEVEKSGGEHTCCVHCPKNNKAKGSGHVKAKKKYKERGMVQLKESRDVNIVYVTSQILTVKKEVVDRTRRNWV